MTTPVTIHVKYLGSGMEYSERQEIGKLVVSKFGDGMVRLEFVKEGDSVTGVTGTTGSVSFPASVASVLTKALLIVAEGHAISIDAKLP